VTLATPTLGRRIRVHTDLPEGLPPVLVDPSQLEAAILNCCLNARDAMPEGGQLTIATASHTVPPDGTLGGAPGTATHEAAGGATDDPPAGAYVRVSMTDTGAGMTPDVLRRAFEPFFTTKGPGGSGLGLSQVYGMVRQSGGAVHIASTPGHGTEVTLLLPCAAA